ncbi:Eukaryotic translation initiation factor 4 gamma 2 [Schistosoma japonicum]|nr:Eukaryotic translation initiation factor 4 gamma 2 [Schistosoma japonicum]KAH8871362.1 Eukaryotic translation initiation factor 4 gamma 2 [Schistosoma japonicum]KAH8871363.1 Eukaryotic translation initiation factor 4 gamma 2 [Schistosoma japonicum]KAH8871364.1 Eukaryotic translation initiation factor 4 gamma 2 [Schistosoma japonicum]KAH8871365.1 Eukaryotic translation initiation factor 4 gamma 2 [Schistosoma japonicum]
MSERVLHNCVQELLTRKGQHYPINDSEVLMHAQEKVKTADSLKERSLSNELECLCQFLTSVGKHMDTPKAKNLMDQYFQRLRRILSRAYESNGSSSNKHENVSIKGKVPPKTIKSNDNCTLSSRVRFMIEDLIDLRENNWIPRRAGQRTEINKPRFLRDIRLEILKESGILVAPSPSERSVTQPDVAGSAFMAHSSASSNSSVNGEFPFVSGLCSGSVMNNVDETKSWMELARMGEELCRQSPRDFSLLDNRNRVAESPTSQFNGRSQSNLATADRRFLSSKSGLSYSNNILRQNSKSNNSDSWVKKSEKIEVNNDIGWVRGVNARSRNSVVTLGNGMPTANANLPPRMLRKLAAEAAGNSPTNSVSNVLNEIKTVSSDAHGFLAKSIPDNLTFTSKNNSLHTISTIHPAGHFDSSDPFEPAYLQRDKSAFVSENKTSTQKLVWSTYPKCAPDIATYNNSHPTLSCKPQSGSRSLNVINKSNFPDIQALTVQKPCDRKIELARPPNSNNLLQLSNNSIENNCTGLHALDESKKIALKFLTLLGDYRDPILVKNQLNSSDFSRITTEVLAIAVLHLCEEGTNLKLAEVEPSELATLFVACSENLLHRDASTSFFNSKDNRKMKPVKLSCHPVSHVWSHLLNKILCVTQLTYSKSKLALISAALVCSRHIRLSEFGEPLRSGKHHPLFLLILQRLAQIFGEDSNSDGNDTVYTTGVTSGDRRSSLIQLFHESELQMIQMVPEGSQTNEALLSLLEERNIDFLVPSLRLSTELFHLVMDFSCLEGKSPEEFDKITASRLTDYLSKHPLSPGVRTSDYTHACLPVIYEYIYKVGVVDLGNLSSPSTLMTREKAAWECIVPQVLIEILRGSTDRQMDALHELQLFWVNKNMPKGFLFRCFMNLYDFELVCENSFLSWKEEVNPNYPAKGQALFEVNRWLTWLETAEEEDEEDQGKSNINDDLSKRVQGSSDHLENSMPAPITEPTDHFIDIMSPTIIPNSAVLGS